MSIKLKFTLSFLFIALLVSGLAIFVVNGIDKSSAGFSDYRAMAKDSVLAGRVQANMLMVRMNVKDYLKTNSQKDLNEFNLYYDKTTNFINEALKEIQKPSRASNVKKISNDLIEYKKEFYKVVSYYKQRDAVVYKNLNVNGKQIEHLLTSVMNSAQKDKDVTSALDVAKNIRTLLLARLYTSKFLISNLDADLERVHKEFTDLSNSLIKTRNGLQNKKEKNL